MGKGAQTAAAPRHCERPKGARQSRATTLWPLDCVASLAMTERPHATPRDLKHALTAAERSGAVGINTLTVTLPELPFGGVELSGTGERAARR